MDIVEAGMQCLVYTNEIKCGEHIFWYPMFWRAASLISFFWSIWYRPIYSCCNNYYSVPFSNFHVTSQFSSFPFPPLFPFFHISIFKFPMYIPLVMVRFWIYFTPPVIHIFNMLVFPKIFIKSKKELCVVPW